MKVFDKDTPLTQRVPQDSLFRQGGFACNQNCPSSVYFRQACVWHKKIPSQKTLRGYFIQSGEGADALQSCKCC